MNILKLISNKILNIEILTPIVFLIIFSILFLFPLPILGIGLRIDDILLLLCVPLIILHLKKVKNNKYNKFILIFLFFILISMLHGYLFLDVPYSSGDVNEYIRYFRIFLFSILLSYIDIHKLSNITFKILYYGSFYIIFVGYLQYFDFFGLGKYLSLLYTSESQIYTAIGHSVRRITITGSGPNDGAIIVSYFLAFNFFAYLFFNNKKYLILFLLLIPTLLFTQSRTVFIGFFVALSISFFMTKGFLTKKILLSTLITLLIIILFPLFSYIYIGIELAINGENNSLLVRLAHINIAYDLFIQSPLLGWGYAKLLYYEMRMDSEYLTILYRFGILGFLSALVLVLTPLFYKKSFDRIRIADNQVFYYMSYLFSILGLFIMLTNSFITGYQTFLPFVLLIVIGFKNFEYYKVNI